MLLKLIVLLVVVLGVTNAYVSPDDHARYNGQRPPVNEGGGRAKPRSLAAQHAEQGAALRAQETTARRRAVRDVAAGSFATSGAGAGGYQGNYGYSGPDYGYSAVGGSGGGGGGNAFPFYPFHNQVQPFGPADLAAFFQYFQQMQQNFQQIAQNQGFSGPGGTGFSGQGGQAGGVYGGSSGDGASAVASIGPQGGYGSAQLSPDLGNRFGGSGGQSGHVPPPNGGTVGVFTSSSSGSSNINGHQTGYKEATSTINDNGKITTFTVRDPPHRN